MLCLEPLGVNVSQYGTQKPIKKPSMNNVLSISGGKDSTAMLLEMLERGEKICTAVFFDTGWEFPQMYDHIDKIEEYTGVRIWRLQSKFPFDYWLIARPVIARKGKYKGQIVRFGNGWPSVSRRWCTREKTDTIHQFVSVIPDPIHCIGYAADENRDEPKREARWRFPLKEYGITESQALDICYSHGFDWGGLYEHFRRVSCFCCPLQRLSELRRLRRHFPALWIRMLTMEDAMWSGTNRGFNKQHTTVYDLERRFANEDRQMVFPIKQEVLTRTGLK